MVFIRHMFCISSSKSLYLLFFSISFRTMFLSDGTVISISLQLELAEYLREVVSNFRESGDRSKNSTLFLFSQKDPFGESFSKIIFISSSEFLFWKKNMKVRNRPKRT